MKRILPAILAILGLAAGTGAGMFLKPSAEEATASVDGDPGSARTAETTEQPAEDEDTRPPRRSEQDNPDNETVFEYVKMTNQFVVPVVTGAKVSALIVLALSIEVSAGQKEAVFVVEPKLRDSFLQVLFNHANSGGFEGAFTSGEKMNDLRGSLFEAAVAILGPKVSDVLVIDIVRQDL